MNSRKKHNAGILSMTIREKSNLTVFDELDMELSVIIYFKHEKQAKGPAFGSISRKLHEGEEPTAIQGSATCAYWNAMKGYYMILHLIL
jgi:hypothetical protein